jgi:hypothetical protein
LLFALTPRCTVVEVQQLRPGRVDLAEGEPALIAHYTVRFPTLPLLSSSLSMLL